MRHAAALLIFPLAFLVASTASARPVDVTTCGQKVVGRGILVGDLDCTGSPGVAVEVERGRLDLNGHTIIGGGTNVAVDCVDSKCKVFVNAGSAEFNNTSCTALPVFLKRSSVTGLADDPGCGSTINCNDVVTCEKPPHLTASTCGTSCQGGTGLPCTSWGVCTND